MDRVTRIVASTIYLFLSSWLVMLLLGVAHSEDARVPTLGYAVTFLLVAALSIATTGEFE